MVVFRRGALEQSPAILAEHGWDEYELLTTPRAVAEAPRVLAGSARAVHHVPAGGVPEAAEALIEAVGSGRLVALGGGRVIDTAKAIVAVRGGEACAIPTTLSGAEMTRIHRLPPDHEAHHLVRPALVIADPSLMSSLPLDDLRASAMNALAHGAEPLYTPLANPVATMVALRGAQLIASALDAGGVDDGSRADLALGSLLCAYALDSGLYAVHHVLCQTIVRVCGTPHSRTNAAMLPHTLEAMRPRAPRPIAALAEAIGCAPEDIGARVADLGGGRTRLRDLGVEREQIGAVVAAASGRGELLHTPSPPHREELEAILERAW